MVRFFGSLLDARLERSNSTATFLYRYRRQHSVWYTGGVEWCRACGTDRDGDSRFATLRAAAHAGPVCAGTERQAQPLSAGSRCWLPMLLAAPRSVDMGGSFLGCEQTSSCAGCGYVGALAGSACAARGGDTSSLPVEPLWSGQDTDVGAIEGARRALSTPRSVDMRGSLLGCEQTRPCAGCSYVRMLAGSACAAGGGDTSSLPVEPLWSGQDTDVGAFGGARRAFDGSATEVGRAWVSDHGWLPGEAM